MPTNFASNATAPRILSTSAAKVVSASGSDMDGGMRIVEECLQDRLRRDLILRVAARLSAHAGRGERLAGRARGETLVDAGDRQAEAALELAREALGAGGHLVLGAVAGGCWRRASRLTRARHRRTVGRNRCRAASSPP